MNPKHPSLRMKKVDKEGDVWSVRIDRQHRAVGVMKEGAMIWFWIGKHDEYERLLSGIMRKVNVVVLLLDIN